MKDIEARKSCAGELRAVVEKLISSEAKVEKDLLLSAAAMLEK